MPIHIDLIGDCIQSKLIISLQSARETSYNTYLKVQDKLTNTYEKVREEKAIVFFNLEFDKLSIEKQVAIKELIPMTIIEEEPK